MGRKIKAAILIFVTSEFFSFLFLFLLINFLSELGILEKSGVLPLSAEISTLIAIIISVIIAIFINSPKKTRWKNFWAMNYPNFILFYCISLLCVSSLKAEVVLILDELREIISLEWTIFGITITVFLVWNVVILQFLRDKKPPKLDGYSPIKAINYIREKGNFHEEVAMTFISVYFLIINLFVLLVTSVLVYFSYQHVTLFIQILTNINFYFCTNTLSMLLLDILRPLKQEKRSMLEESKITDADLKLQNDFRVYIDRTLNAIKVIKETSALSEKEKAEIQTKILADTLNMLTTAENQSNSTKDTEEISP